MILGNGELVGSLMAVGLIDEYVLMIHPLVLGGGRPCPLTSDATATI